MTEALPDFPYHPDPVATESVARSDATCVCCGRRRGFVYAGAPYGEGDFEACICPWCIADGSAAERLDVEFNALDSIPEGVPRGVVETIAARTPGYFAWQTERWLFHCDDGAAFLGAVGRRELEDHPDALEMLRHEHDEYGWPPEQVAEYVEGLDKDGQPTAYLFRCRHCGTHLAYSDFT